MAVDDVFDRDTRRAESVQQWLRLARNIARAAHIGASAFDQRLCGHATDLLE
jgi:hypothetical protein